MLGSPHLLDYLLHVHYNLQATVIQLEKEGYYNLYLSGYNAYYKKEIANEMLLVC